jgi:(p)ppGpp synthase/HD superfamily hydrolase
LVQLKNDGQRIGEDWFQVVGTEEFSLRNIKAVGVDSLMAHLAKCRKSAPPDASCGIITRGKGVGVRCADCSNLGNWVTRSGDRFIKTVWRGCPGYWGLWRS